MTFNPGVSPFRLRFSISNDGAGPAAGPYQLYASKNGGAWTPVTTTSTIGVKSTDAGFER